MGAGLIGYAFAGDDDATRIALIALGAAIVFASVALVGSSRREAASAAAQSRIEAKLDELIELERSQLVESRRTADATIRLSQEGAGEREDRA